MAARNLADVRALDREMVFLNGSCVGNGAANPTAVKGRGIASIAWVSTGLYTITLADKWNVFGGAVCTVIDPTTTHHWEVTVVAETVASTKTVQIKVFHAATAAAPALADLTSDETLKFFLILFNTAQAPTAR